MIQRLAAWLGWHLGRRKRNPTDDEKYVYGVVTLALIAYLLTPQREKPKPEPCYCGNPDCRWPKDDVRIFSD